MSRPKSETEQVCLRFPAVMLKRMVALAKEDGRTRGDVMQEAMLRGLRILEAERQARK